MTETEIVERAESIANNFRQRAAMVDQEIELFKSDIMARGGPQPGRTYQAHRAKEYVAEGTMVTDTRASSQPKPKSAIARLIDFDDW